MLDPYGEQILERYKHPRFAGSLERATHTADGLNASCGDEVHIELEVVDGTIARIAHRCRACAICSASADLLAEQLTGKLLKELKLMGGEEVREILGVPLSPVRLKCALLPLETIQLALSDQVR